jgi:hypothetical protein
METDDTERSCGLSYHFFSTRHYPTCWLLFYGFGELFVPQLWTNQKWRFESDWELVGVRQYFAVETDYSLHSGRLCYIVIAANIVAKDLENEL